MVKDEPVKQEGAPEQSKETTFGRSVALILDRCKVGLLVRPKEGIRWDAIMVSPRYYSEDSEYRLTEGAKLEPEQMMAAVQADPDNLVGRCEDTLTCYVDGLWLTWDSKLKRWSDRTILPKTWIGKWNLERRPKGKLPLFLTRPGIEKAEQEQEPYYKAKQDNGKPRPSLIPWAGIWQVIKALNVMKNDE